MLKKLFKIFFWCAWCANSAPGEAIEHLPSPHVRLQMLDKVTGHTQIVEIHHQEPITFGTLKIHCYRCHRSSLQEVPWSTAYLEVWEEQPYQESKPVYKGWIFSSSPATIEHPVYDIRLLECMECTTCCQDSSFLQPVTLKNSDIHSDTDIITDE